MNIERIDKDFETLIMQRGIYKKLGLTPEEVKYLRHNIRTGKGISIEKKMKVLQKSGWQQDQAEYTRQELIGFAKFVLRSGAAAKELGVAYLFDKWKAKNE